MNGEGTGPLQLQQTFILELLEPSAVVGKTEINPRNFVTNLSCWSTGMRHFSAEVLIYWYLLCFCCHANSRQRGFKATASGPRLRRLDSVQENHKGLFFFLKVLDESGAWRIAIVFVVVTVFYLFIFLLCLVTDGAKVQTPRFTGSFTVCFSETVRATWPITSINN